VFPNLIERSHAEQNSDDSGREYQGCFPDRELFIEELYSSDQYEHISQETTERNLNLMQSMFQIYLLVQVKPSPFRP
jgi:hypothetical protein